MIPHFGPPPPARTEPGPPGGVSRRSVVVGIAGVAGLALAGCDAGGAPSTGTSSSARPASTGVTPDVAVATTALAEIRTTRAAVRATLSRYPAERALLAALLALHTTHEATLVDAVPTQAATSAGPAPYAVPRQRDRALRVLAAREQHLHATLDGLALHAQSGQFARVLASMGAAVAQRLAVWP